MSQQNKEHSATNAPLSEEELDKLRTRHDVVHHTPTPAGGGGLASRGKSLEDQWIKQEEKRKAEEKKQKEAAESNTAGGK
jgi:hypothetical protein